MALENIPTIGPGALNANLDKVVVYKNGGSEAAVSLLTLTNSALNLSGVYLDPINGRVGIGVPNPVYPLDVANAGRIGGIVLNDGGSDNRITASNPYLFLIAGGAILQMQGGGFSTGQYNTTAKFDIKGKGSTSATTSLLVQNSSGTNLLEQKDDGSLYVGTTASNLGIIYVPHSPTYAQRTFLRMQSGGREIFATSSNDGLVVKTLGTTFEAGITINDGYIAGQSTAVGTNRSAYNLPTQINCYGSANSCLINLSGGGRLQGSSDAQYIRVEGTIQLDGASNELKGFFFNPTLTGAYSNQNVLAIHSTYGGAYLNTATPQASAVLQADSVTQGFLKPKMTTAQKNAIVTPAAGLEVYDTDLNRPCFYNGTSWITL